MDEGQAIPRVRRTSGIALERLAYDPGRWDTMIADEPEATVFHSSAWLEFLAASQGAEPVVAVVRDDTRPVGYFVGAVVRRFGVRILGSPLKGWGTATMGFVLREEADRRAAAQALVRFAFRDLGCVHLELIDSRLTPGEMAGSGYVVEEASTFVIDLSAPEDVVFGRIRRTTRQAIRTALRQGVTTEIATDPGFADDFHAQLRIVFARQGLAPPYGVGRVRCLIDALGKSGQLLLVRLRTPDGSVAATGIAVGRGDDAFAWGAAWPRGESTLHPIELLWWELIRLERERGAVRLDCGGLGDYKAKYGGVARPAYRFHRSRYPGLRHGRAIARHLVRARQRLMMLGG